QDCCIDNRQLRQCTRRDCQRPLQGRTHLPSHRTRPTVTAAEIATLDCVTWWGMKRLHKVLGHRIPAEAEASYTHPKTTAPATVLPRNETPGASVRVWFSARSDPIDRASTKPGAIQAVGSSERLRIYSRPPAWAASSAVSSSA